MNAYRRKMIGNWFLFHGVKKKNIQGVSRAVFVLHFCPPSLDLVDSLFTLITGMDHLKTLEAFS